MLSITVNSPYGGIDGNPNTTTLHEAIALANSSPGVDTIDFDSNVFDGSNPIVFEPGSGELLITDDIVINGRGADLVTVDANGLSRVLRINSGVTITLSDMTLTGGTAAYGGGVLASSCNLTLQDMVFVSNTATSSHGGGMYIGTGSTVTIENTVFLGNRTLGPGTGSWGGTWPWDMRLAHRLGRSGVR